MNFPFDTERYSRVIVTWDDKKRMFTAALRLNGVAQGYGIFSSGNTAEIAFERALECLEKPERWRKLAF